MVEKLVYESNNIKADIEKKKVRKKDEVIPFDADVMMPRKVLAQYVGMLFNPEPEIWVVIRKIANLMTIVGMIVLLLKVVIFSG